LPRLYIKERETTVLDEKGEGAVLAPSLYWYAFAPLKKVSQRRARAMADALLKPRPKNYRDIVVQKREGGYDCFAYDAEALRRRLRQEGLEKEPVWFLQQLAHCTPFSLTNGRTATVLNGIVLEVPAEGSEKALSFATCMLPEPLLKQKSTESGEVLGWLKAATVTVAVAALLDIGSAWQEKRAWQARLASLKMDKTAYEMRAMVNRYEKVAGRLQAMGEALAKALKKRGVKHIICTPKGCDVE